MSFVKLIKLLINLVFLNYLNLINALEMMHRKVILIRFYLDNLEINELKINQNYLIDILAYNLSEFDSIYLVKRTCNLLTKVQLNLETDIRINYSNETKLDHKFSNFKYIHLIANYLNNSIVDQFQYLYSSVRFQKFQDGHYSVCVQQNRSEKSCVHQGSDELLSFKVHSDRFNLVIIIFFFLLALFLSALTAALTLGIMSLDTHELQVLIKAGNKDEREAASAILPLRKKANFLLCTFVIANTISESMLNYTVSFVIVGPMVVIVSTVFIVLFGQIVPLALSTRYGLLLGARTIYLTYFFIITTFLFSYPLSLALDSFLGEETPTVYDKERLIEYIKLTRPINKLGNDQLGMITGAVFLRDKTVGQAMTKLKDVYMLSVDLVLTPNVVRTIFKKGFSRIPIYKEKRNKIVSILFLKDLVLLKEPITIKDLVNKTNHFLAFTDENEKIAKILNYMKKGKTHMIIVRKLQMNTHVVTGIITLEDIIEEILQTEINDEADYQNVDKGRSKMISSTDYQNLDKSKMMSSNALIKSISKTITKSKSNIN